MQTATRFQIEQQLKSLEAEARRIQSEQHRLITSRRNPARFGQLEQQLEGPNGIWARIDTLRQQLAATEQ